MVHCKFLISGEFCLGKKLSATVFYLEMQKLKYFQEGCAVKSTATYHRFEKKWIITNCKFLVDFVLEKSSMMMKLRTPKYKGFITMGYCTTFMRMVQQCVWKLLCGKKVCTQIPLTQIQIPFLIKWKTLHEFITNDIIPTPQEKIDNHVQVSYNVCTNLLYNAHFNLNPYRHINWWLCNDSLLLRVCMMILKYHYHNTRSSLWQSGCHYTNMTSLWVCQHDCLPRVSIVTRGRSPRVIMLTRFENSLSDD